MSIFSSPAGQTLKGLATGSIFSEDEDAAAQDYLNQILAQYEGMNAPTIGPMQKYEMQPGMKAETIAAGPDLQARLIEAQEAAATDMGPSAMEGIALDPALRQQQMASMAALQDIANSGGLTSKDKANLSRIETDNATADRGRREAIRQNMAARGMGGSGMDLLAQLQSSQAATDRAAQQGLDVAGMAEQRALDAIMQSGNLAGNLRGQDYSEASQKAKAQDAIAQFNAANKNQFAQYNAGQRSAANQFNAQNQMQMDRYNRDNSMQAQQFNAGAKNQFNQFRQGMANQNTDIQNRNAVDLPQQRFQNQMSIAQGKAGAYGQGMQNEQLKSKQARDAWGNIIAGGAKAGAAAMA
jgi:hypothetical protein